MKTIERTKARAAEGTGRARVHKAVRSQRAPLGPGRSNPARRRAMCERCGNVYRGKRWLAATPAEASWPVGVTWVVCPACRQVAMGEYFGRLVARGASVAAHEDEIRARVAHVAARARFTEPQRRVVSIERRGDEIEILTTSQKLAHRVASALVHAFGGRATYHWSPEDGALEATWSWGRSNRASRR